MYEFGDAEIEAAVRVLRSRTLFRYLPDAREVDDFERSLARHVGVLHAVGVSSGTAALVCGLSALGVGPGEEVVVPAFGFVAEVLAPLAVGALPVVCDIDESLTMDADDLARRISPRTRAVLPVHIQGHAANMDRICAAAADHGLSVLEDASQAIGGTYHGRHLGTIGDAGAFSFNQHKIITAGEGGALVTDHGDVYQRAFVSHDGSSSMTRHHFPDHDFAGLAFRLSEVSAAILNAQLARLDDILASLRSVRQRVASALDAAADLRGITVHDPAGSCGTHLGYLFDSPETSARFQAAVDSAEIAAFPAVGYGHSFAEWSVLHERRGGHHPARNPLLTAERVQGPEDCAASRDILARCVLVRYPMDVSDAAIDDLQRRVGKELG